MPGTNDFDVLRLSASTTEIVPYHGKPKRASAVDPEQRQFIAWDGEGADLDGPGKPQHYILFGCSTGAYISDDHHIHTFDLLDFIVRIGQENPTAFHVGFAFGYDSNMIVRSLSRPTLQRLHENGKVTLKRQDGVKYHVQYMPKKWFSVTRYHSNWDRRTNPHAKITVKIYDLFTFFAKSFIKAYEELCGPAPEIVKSGKANRGQFDALGASYIQEYWSVEIQMLRELAEELRRRLYGAGLRITQWHGPGALASFALRQHKINEHMSQCPDEVREAAKYAYAGGRFEIFHLGRTPGPIYSVDINSAYPYAISQLPSLASGSWTHVTGDMVKRHSNRIARFGVYFIRLNPLSGDSFVERSPGPLFHRDKVGNISFPWVIEGWYWSPEVHNLLSLAEDRYTIVEGWEFVGGKLSHTDPPFHWVREMYQQRREWKAKGFGAQLALKLCMNSLYGKMAQRVGWNEEKRKPPAWHQLEWAGWVTSYTRAMLWEVMSRIPVPKIIAVETDGLYTTMPPELLGISNSSELGGWEVSQYDEILYVQSGMAWLRKGDEWTCKRRGLDAKTFELGDCIKYLHSLTPNQPWESYKGRTTRFIGLGAALNGSAPLKVKHCVWQTTDREIRPGQDGKRVHMFGQCRACRELHTAWDAPHDMSIRSLAYADPMSYPHDIPWDDDPEQAWRQTQRELDGYARNI